MCLPWKNGTQGLACFVVDFFRDVVIFGDEEKATAKKQNGVKTK